MIRSFDSLSFLTSFFVDHFFSLGNEFLTFQDNKLLQITFNVGFV